MSDKLPSGSLLTLILVFLAGLIDGLDVTIVSIGLPTMAHDFDISLSQSSWFIFSYVAALAAFLLPLGKRAKNNRVKRYMVLGTALFGFSSFMCGLSDSFWMLVAFRTIQGVAAAMMSSVLPSIIVHMLPVDRKGLGMSVLGASSAIAFIIGPLIGGALLSFTTWHWMFFINVPFCIVIVLLALKHLPADRTPDRDKDPTPLGGVSALVLIGSLLIFMEDQGDPDINSLGRIICVVLIAVSAVALYYSIRRDTEKAIIAPRMLNREYNLVTMSFLLCTIVVAGAQYLLPYLLQQYYGLSTAASGAYMAAMSVAMVIMVLPVGRMCDRYGCRTPVVIAVVARATFCALAILLTVETEEPLFMIPALVIFGISHAFSGTAQPTRMIHHSTPGYEDESTNFMLVVNYVASSLGVVIFALLFGLFSPGNLEDLSGQAFLDGFLPTMWFSIIILAIALVCTLVVKNKIVRKE